MASDLDPLPRPEETQLALAEIAGLDALDLAGQGQADMPSTILILGIGVDAAFGRADRMIRRR